MTQPFASFQPVGDMRQNDHSAEHVKTVRSEYQDRRNYDKRRDQ